jgi:hypothetical protein
MSPHVLTQWNYVGSDESLFLWERSTDSASTWPLKLVFSNTASSYVDAAVNWYGTYWYKVAPVNPKGTGSFSSVVSVYIMPPAFDIASLTASHDSLYRTGSYLVWNYSGSSQGGTDSFFLERSLNAGVTWPTSRSINAASSSWTDAAVSYSNTYWYRITPISNTGLTVPTSNVSASFIQAPNPTIYTWQTGSSAIAFWNYLGTFSMSLSRSADGGATWPFTTVIAPISASTYYFIDPSTVIGNTYTYRIQEIATPDQPVTTGPAKTIQPYPITTSLSFTGDAGFELGGNVPWDVHTASLLNMNDTMRGTFGVRKFITGGDNGYQGPNWYGGYQGQCFELLGPSESMWATYGNHDSANFGNVAFKNYFGLPSTYYTWKEGCIFGVSLAVISETGNNLLSGSAQWVFLSQSLSQSMGDPTVAWRVVTVHAPVLSSNWKHPGNSISAAEVPWEKWGVNAILSGHNHSVERLESGSVAQILCGGGSNEKSGYYLRAGGGSPYSKWYNVDIDDGFGPYSNGYIFTLIEATDMYMSMSFYSGSIKLPDTGSTAIFNATMSGNSLIFRKMPPQAIPALTANVTNI